MASIQGAVNSVIGSIGAVAGMAGALKPRQAQPVNPQAMTQSVRDVEKQKLMRLKQRAALEKQRALYQKAKLDKEKAKQGLKDLKQTQGGQVRLGGETIKDPKILDMLKEQKNGK